MIWWLVGLLLQSVPYPVTFILDDAHPASAMIQGYRWNVNGVRYSTKVVKAPPCVDCMTRTYQLPPGSHTVIVTPYTKSGDLVNEALTYDVVVEVTSAQTEQTVLIQLAEKPSTRR